MGIKGMHSLFFKGNFDWLTLKNMYAMYINIMGMQ